MASFVGGPLHGPPQRVIDPGLPAWSCPPIGRQGVSIETQADEFLRRGLLLPARSPDARDLIGLNRDRRSGEIFVIRY